MFANHLQLFNGSRTVYVASHEQRLLVLFGLEHIGKLARECSLTRTLQTVMLWICDRWTGVGSNTVAMIPIVVFAFTGVIKARDLEEINWSVIWMVAGGFALGLAAYAVSYLTTLPGPYWHYPELGHDNTHCPQ